MTRQTTPILNPSTAPVFVRFFLYTKEAVQQKETVASTFIKKPQPPVWLIVIISMKATTMEIIAAARGPKVKPPIQMTTSLKSKSRNMTEGISLDTSITM